ncbi:phage tail protein [Sphingopyxis sp. PET50]|uniref:phage tail protein n=1 Tax=Sphingopyxis sp. PET50 TaxID=2976533 RepID=UPI0021AEE822|nr:phage tail protein [Sphingopyxis sp. PET50]
MRLSIAAVASIGAQLTAKKPPAQGSVNNVTIDPNAASPCIIGRTYYGGVLRHDVGYGGKVGKVQNPYRGMVIDYSVCGPLEGLVSMHADFVTVGFSGSAATGYYSTFMYRDYQLGDTPESAALSPQWGGMPGWGSSHKLSGKAAILWSLKFDKDGKVYTSGVPQLGAVWDGVKVYDPRLDDTYDGGSGSHRSDDRTTWEFSEWPDDHALTYAIGHWFSGKKMFGIGLPIDSIDVDAFVAWGNVCRTNGWKVGGVIFEPGDRWANLKRIMAAGSAEPIFSGGMLSVKYDAPRVSLVTITPDDYADGAYRTPGMQTWRERLNTIIPKYRSPDHKWEYVESDAITSSTYLDEDGEEKIDTYQIDLCQEKDQAAQLAAYKLVNGREMFPIERNLKPEFRFYRPGDMVTINDPEGGLIEQDCVIVRRSVDPQTLAVRWVLTSETIGKHEFALGKTGTAPPTPTLLDPADRDAAANINNEVSGARRLVSQSVVYPITSDDDSITISAFVGVINDGRSISFPSDSVTGLANGTEYALLWHIADEEYSAVEYPAETEMADASFVFLGWVSTSTSGTFPTPDPPPGGWGGGGSYPQLPEVSP